MHIFSKNFLKKDKIKLIKKYINNVFNINTINDWKIRKDNKLPIIKYIITLDADTDLILNSGIQLIGSMAHILNKPIVEKNKGGMQMPVLKVKNNGAWDNILGVDTSKFATKIPGSANSNELDLSDVYNSIPVIAEDTVNQAVSNSTFRLKITYDDGTTKEIKVLGAEV